MNKLYCSIIMFFGRRYFRYLTTIEDESKVPVAMIFSTDSELGEWLKIQLKIKNG